MTAIEPRTKLDERFSSKDAAALPWSAAVAILDTAERFWITTVRPDGRPHVTPLMAAWPDDALHFRAGKNEYGARNLALNPHCILTTGCNPWKIGVDFVLEGDTVLLSDRATRQRPAAWYIAKYDWAYTVDDGASVGEVGNVAQVYRVAPETFFGFGKGESFSQTRCRF